MQRHFRLTFCPCFKTKLSFPSREHQDERSTHFDDSQANITNRTRPSASVAVDNTRSVPMPHGMVLKDEPYVVHTSVDYTNCLVPALDRIIAAPYYWGIMDRFEAEELLEDKPEGTFLLRDSAQSEYLFSVSFRRYKRTLHARIEQKNHRFSFDFSDTSVYSADTITDLIAYYKDPSKCMFFEPQLSIPLPRNFPFSLQEICRARIATMTTFDGVQKLTLPSILKEFVREYYYKHPVKMIDHIPRTDQLEVRTSQLRTA